MDVDVVASYAWIGWIVLIGAFLVVEMLTLSLTFLMLAGGAIAGLAVAAAGGPPWLQLVSAAAVAVLLLFALRPALRRLLRRGEDPARSNIDALLGMQGTVVLTVTPHAGQVRLANGELWTARTTEPDLPPGTDVAVREIGGAVATVARAARHEGSSA